jgi:hypothetical protein
MDLRPSLTTWFSVAREILVRVKQICTVEILHDHVSVEVAIPWLECIDIYNIVCNVYCEETALKIKIDMLELFECPMCPSPEWLKYAPGIDYTTYMRKMVSDIMIGYGYEWNGYYSFINVTHPAYLAMKGKLPLAPDTFPLVYPNTDAIVSEMVDGVGELGDASRRFYALSHTSGSDYLGWSVKKIKEAIIELGLESVINFQLITGDPTDLGMSLPGLGFPLYDENDMFWRRGRVEKPKFCEVYWKTAYVCKGYYIGVYSLLCKLKEGAPV